MNLEEPSPKFLAVPPETITKELRVTTTAATDDLTPTVGKKLE